MTLTISTRSRWIRTGWKVRNWLAYRAFLRRHCRDAKSCVSASSQSEGQLNEQLRGYPSNHCYRIQGGGLVPGFQLYERWREVEPTLPQRLDSFLDIGCCRGFYVLQAAQRPECRLAVGVDVYEPFVSVAGKVGTQLGLTNVTFHTVTLDRLAQNAAAYGGPFQVTLLLGTYHYLFWGSGRSDFALRSHEKILACLANLTTDRLILSARLELDRLPSGLKKQAYSSPEAGVYNTHSFLRAAESFFDIEQAGFLSRYPLLMMHKRANAPTASLKTAVASSV